MRGVCSVGGTATVTVAAGQATSTPVTPKQPTHRAVWTGPAAQSHHATSPCLCAQLPARHQCTTVERPTDALNRSELAVPSGNEPTTSACHVKSLACSGRFNRGTPGNTVSKSCLRLHKPRSAQVFLSKASR